LATPAQRDVIGGHWRGRLLRLLSDAASMLLDDRATVGDRVHNVRRLAKEGRALLKLAPPTLANDARKHRVTLRAIRQSLGPARDARVNLQLAEKRKPKSKPEQAATLFLRSKLGAVCALEEAALTANKLEEIAASLTATAQAIAGWRLPHRADPLFRNRIAKAYRSARRLIPESDEPDFAVLHALRSAIVDHLYQLGLVGESDARLARRIKSLHKLREGLGDYLDHARLRQTADDLAHGKEPPSQPIAHKRIGRNLMAARRLFADRPAAFRAKLGG
jgi:CHAD domain-containing protein